MPQVKAPKTLDDKSKCQVSCSNHCGGKNPKDASQATLWVVWMFGCPVDFRQADKPKHKNAIPVCEDCFEIIHKRWLFNTPEVQEVEYDGMQSGLFRG